MKNINIVWVGYHQEGVKAFQSILKKGYNVTKFITLDDDTFMKRSAGTREYAELCSEYNVSIGLISTIKNEEVYQLIKEAEPDLLIVLGWSEILPERVLDIPSIGTVGAHAAMLPHNRGSAPINWAIIKGETECGNSLMWLDKMVDQGDIIDQIGFEITKYDTCTTLYEKVAITNEVMLNRLIDRLLNDLPTVMGKKNVTDEPLLPRRRPKDGLVSWDCESTKAYDFIRALTRPYPGAFSYLNGKKYFIWNASLVPTTTKNMISGKIEGAVYNPIDFLCGIQVSCKIGCLIIHDLEDEEGNTFTGKEIIDLQLSGVFGDEQI